MEFDFKTQQNGMNDSETNILLPASLKLEINKSLSNSHFLSFAAYGLMLTVKELYVLAN